MKVFTKNGLSDKTTDNISAFSITITQNLNFAEAKDQLVFLFELSTVIGYKMTNVVKKDTIINGNNSFLISYTETDDDDISYKNIVFNAFVVKGNSVILFKSGDLDNGKYIEKFKQTFFTLNL